MDVIQATGFDIISGTQKNSVDGQIYFSKSFDFYPYTMGTCRHVPATACPGPDPGWILVHREGHLPRPHRPGRHPIRDLTDRVRVGQSERANELADIGQLVDQGVSPKSQIVAPEATVHVSRVPGFHRTGRGDARPCSIQSTMSRLRILPLAVSGICSSSRRNSGMSYWDRPLGPRDGRAAPPARTGAPGAKHHGEADLLAEPRVRDRDRGDALDRRMPHGEGLDARRIDVVAAADDDVLLAAGDAQVAVRVEPAEIAGHEPAVAH